MNTYRAVHLETGRWAVEWSVGGAVLANTCGTFDTEADAAFAALARDEWEGASRLRPSLQHRTMSRYHSGTSISRRTRTQAAHIR